MKLIKQTTKIFDVFKLNNSLLHLKKNKLTRFSEKKIVSLSAIRRLTKIKKKFNSINNKFVKSRSGSKFVSSFKGQKFKKIRSKKKIHIKQKKRFILLEKRRVKRWVYSKGLQKKFSVLLNIRIRSNNIFCNLKNVDSAKTLKVKSGGVYRINISKKKLRYSLKPVLTSFFRESKRELYKKNIFVNLISPKKFRRQAIEFIRPKILFPKNTHIIKIKEKKCFNGCRVKKKKRKKRKGLRLLKE